MSEYRIEGFIGEDSATAAALAAFLAQHAGQPVRVLVNSPGGDAFEGAAMLAELERHGQATTVAAGIAASAASLALMGGREIVVHRDAMMMIHDPSGMTFGTATAHRSTADTLDKLSGTYAKSYARASGQPVARIRAWMQAETWIDADEAVALNFADRIEGGEPVAYARFDPKMFRRTPAAVMARMAAQMEGEGA